ncbi:hypothetical protein N665_0188s0297 [Sinapis alba]|nr:hypothetical protein N665_0188s0297 [Sinapis alba]
MLNKVRRWFKKKKGSKSRSSPSSSLYQRRTAFPHLELTVLVKALEDHGNNPPASGDDWVALLVREVTQSTGTDDAKVREATVLEALEKCCCKRYRLVISWCTFIDYKSLALNTVLYVESVAVQPQVEALIKDNAVLKRAVAIQHERHA